MSEPTARVSAEDVQAIERLLKDCIVAADVMNDRQCVHTAKLILNSADAARPVVERLKRELNRI